MAKKSYEYQGHVFEDNGHGDLYNAEVDRFLIFRPHPMMVQTIVHKDDSVTMNQEKFKENTDENKGVYEEGYEINDDGSVFVKPDDVDPKIKKESENNKNLVDGPEVFEEFKKGMKESFGDKIQFADEKTEDEFDQPYDEEYYEAMNDRNPNGLNTKQDYEDDLKWFEGMEATHGSAGLDQNEDYQSLKEEYESKFNTTWNTPEELKGPHETGIEDEVFGKKSTSDGIQHEYTSFFTMENPLMDMDAAQEYLDADDMTQYLDEPLKGKIDSMKWVLDDDQSGHVEVKTNSTLTDQEQQELEDWIDGQNSDGLGEGFEQQDFANAYWNPETGDGPYTYEEAQEAIDDMIENIDASDYFDYVDESELEAAIDTYLEDNDLITEYKENNWEEVKDELFAYHSTDDVISAAEAIKGDDLSDEEMDELYNNFDNDPDFKDQVAEELWQNLASYEQADLIKGLDQSDSLRDEARDGIYDDPEGYLSDSAIYDAKQEYANQALDIDVDNWGGMSSIRRSVDGLQDKVKETTWTDWVNENLDRDKTPSQIAQDYQKVMDNINETINSYDNDDRFDIADSYLERNGITESNGYDTSYIMRLRNGIIESLHIDEDANPRDFGVTDEDIKLADQYDKENNRKSWDEVKSENDLPMTQDEYHEFKRKLDTQENMTFNEYRMGLAMDRYERGYNANDLSYQDLKDIQDYREMKELYEPKERITKIDADVSTLNGFNDDYSDRYIRNEDLYETTNRMIENLKSADKYSSLDISGPGNYHISKYPDGNIQISSNHPYDLSNYSYAKWADYNNAFSIYDANGKLVTVVNTIEEAVEEMRKIDSKIKAHIDRT